MVLKQYIRTHTSIVSQTPSDHYVSNPRYSYHQQLQTRWLHFQALALCTGEDFLILQYNPLALLEPSLAPVTYSTPVGKRPPHCHLLSALASLPLTIQSMTLTEAWKNQKPLCHPLTMHLPTDLRTHQVAAMGMVMNQAQTPIQNQTTQTRALRRVPLTC
jgi:hypothetical protein